MNLMIEVLLRLQTFSDRHDSLAPAVHIFALVFLLFYGFGRALRGSM